MTDHQAVPGSSTGSGEFDYTAAAEHTRALMTELNSVLGGDGRRMVRGPARPSPRRDQLAGPSWLCALPTVYS